MLFTTLAVVPVAVAVALLTAVSLLALAAVAVVVVRRPVTLVAAAFAFGVVLEPVRLTLSFGQVNLVLMVLVVADCLLPRTWWPRGALIGLAAAVKLTPFAFLLFFAAHRRWRPVLTAVGAFAAVSALVWVLAPAETPAYLSTVLGDPTRIGGLTYTGNQSLNGFWHRLGLGDGLTTALWLASALVVAALGWVAVRRSRVAGDDLGALLAAAAAGLLASPVSWSHHWVWAVLAGVWVAPRLREWRRPGRIAAVAGLLVFVVPPHWVLPNRYDRERGEQHRGEWRVGERQAGAVPAAELVGVHVEPVEPRPAARAVDPQVHEVVEVHEQEQHGRGDHAGAADRENPTRHDSPPAGEPIGRRPAAPPARRRWRPTPGPATDAPPACAGAARTARRTRARHWRPHRSRPR
jgi:alpha-1,2-mannosyltransferase